MTFATRQGNPCKRGHSGLRFVTSRGCIECRREKQLGIHSPAESGAATFQGDPCRNGHDGLRYTKGKNCVICARNKAADYRLKNPDKTRKMNAVWRALNPEKLAADKRRFREENRELVRSFNRNAKARRRLADGHHNGTDIDAIRKVQGDCCFYCGDNLNRLGHVDHFTPLLKGGSNWPENLVIACSDCNLSKGAKNPLDWILEKEFTGIVAIISESSRRWVPGRQLRR